MPVSPSATVLRVRGCSLTPPALLGALALVVLVGAAGRAPVPVGVVPPASFLGLLDPARRGGTGSAVLVLLSLATLVGAWWQVMAVVRRRQVGTGAVLATVALWLVPVLLAPPLLSMDGYAYLAQGRMLLEGLDPYAGGPVLLGDSAAATHVDPMWRASPVPYGPTALALLRAVALAGDHVVLGVLLLRLLVLLGVAAAVAVALELAPRRHRASVLALTALNPITIVHLVGGVHLDAVLAAVVGLSVLALVRGRLWLAWVLAAAALAVKVTAAPLLPFVLLALHARGARWRTLLPTATALAVLPLLAAGTALDRPWGFLPALLVPGTVAPWYAPATLVGAALAGVSTLLGLPLSDAVPLLLGRVLVLALGAAFVLRQLRAQWREPGPPDPLATARRIGSSLLVAGLCLPALYGWYLAAGLFLLAAAGIRRWTTTVVLLSSALLFTSLPALYDVNPWPLVLTWAVLLLGLAATARVLRRPTGAPQRQPLVGEGARAGRASLLARAAGLALLVVVGIGGLTPMAVEANPTREGTTADRMLLVTQLEEQYPTLQIATVLPPDAAAGGGGVYRVELVQPGAHRCRLRMVQTVGPLALFQRLPETPAGSTLRAMEERTCPPAQATSLTP